MVCAKCQGSKLLPGYKLRKHISKALQARSQAVRTALDRYNTAAEAMSPPRRTLQWQDIVEYAFLADFDLLRDSRNDIQSHQWATAGHLAMDLFFKIEQAHEEIACLNVEIRRVLTYIIDEDNFLLTAQAVVQRTNPLLAHVAGRKDASRTSTYTSSIPLLYSQASQDVWSLVRAWRSSQISQWRWMLTSWTPLHHTLTPQLKILLRLQPSVQTMSRRRKRWRKKRMLRMRCRL